jgi:glucose-1-phosphate cytidylyltransferase
MMKAVILAGGLGTRLREETEFKPKPMVEVGQRPILWHIMKNLSTQGINEFVVCLGYKGEMIKDYFLNYAENTHDVTVQLGSKDSMILHNDDIQENWSVTLANTGALTMTGGRIHKIQKYVENEKFLCTYGDGLADIDIGKLSESHAAHQKIATVTAVRPANRFGALELGGDGLVAAFSEKPKSEKWVNGGFFIFEPQVFDYLDQESILEKNPLESIAREGLLNAYQHHGFWQPMDTYREVQELNVLWETDKAPWKNWE